MAWAAVAGNHAHNIASNVTTFTLTGFSVTANNRVVVEFEANQSNAAQVTSVTDNFGTTDHDDAFTTYTDGGFQSRASKFSGVVGSTGAITITCHMQNNGGTGGGAASAQEYSGTATAGTSADVDVGTSTHGTAGGTPTVTTGTATTAANELVSGGFSDDGSNVTPTGKNGAGFTERDSSGPSSVSESYLEDKDSGASGATQTANMSAAIGTFWAMSCVVYKNSGGAAPAPVLTPMRTRSGAGI